MPEQYDADVAVIGYGPTGLIAALALAQRGARVIAFEREESIYPRARAVTVNDWTMRIFQSLDIDERVREVIEPQRGLRWLTYDREEVMRVMHPESTLGVKPRLYNIYQPTMEATLREAGQDLYGDRIDVRYGDEVVDLEQDADGVTVIAKDRDGGRTTTRARYAIAADGGSSRTRELLGIELLGETVDTQWIIIDCHAKRWWPDRDFLTFWTDRERPVVDIALSAGAHRWEIPLKPGESPDDYATEEQVWPLLNALGHDERDVDIHQWAFYRHHVRTADRWREGRVFLAGDAAHLMPPWAGAGMQSGIRDVHNLGWKLGRVLTGELGEEWLDTYEAERRPNVEFFTNLAVDLGRVIKQEATEEELVRHRTPDPSFKVTPWEPASNRPPALTAGWFRGPFEDASPIGRMLPQPVLYNAVGRMGRLDDFLGDHFVLLGDDVDPAEVMPPEEKAQWDALGARYVAVRPQSVYSEGPDDLIDISNVLLPWMRRYGSRVIAVRPDRFVAAADKHGLAVPTL
ncbi:MAG: bifunctional 3-(3-hydroxy-phenyl)propionate/3-hydroxycinnamic acid hydroxylase [Nocardioides sp.]|nr:bifunctional 3-(3-hydroxy-phenyl)propionate/3-hydroxycinnamic acid hydroxylase [Nocardioides sp.]